MVDWFDANKIIVNPPKIKGLIIITANIIHTQNMKSVPPFKLLAAEINKNLTFNLQNLTFNLHISNISRSAANQLIATI